MATLTKTYKENTNYAGGSYATWTVTVSHNDVTVSGSTVTFSAPTVTVKYVGSNKGYASVMIGAHLYGTTQGAWTGSGQGIFHTGSSEYGSRIALASNTTKTLNYYNNGMGTAINTTNFFNSSNRTSKTIAIHFASVGYGLYSSNSSETYSSAYIADVNDVGTLFTLTLNAPPTVSVGTPTYATPHFTGLGAYSVEVTQAKAQYQGYISSMTLTVGTDSVTQTYSATTVSNETLTVTPTVAGTYTPTLKVTDTRGQTTTTTFSQITVGDYSAPSATFDVYRSDASGIKDDEGHYGLIDCAISYTSAVANLVAPTVTVKDSNNTTVAATVTWYDTYADATGVSGAISDWTTVGSGDHIYAVIDCDYAQSGAFAETESYQITLVAEDSVGSTSSAITQTLSTAFYTIDFQAGGKEIVFGGPAKDNVSSIPNGLFKCNMDALLIGTTEVSNPYYSLDTSAASGTDHDLYAAITALSWQSDVIV